ncbi:MAG: glycosyltransferase, partial [Candidatus Aenigmatarchaeota archaeon]
FRFFEFFFISKFFTNKIIVTSREYIQSSIFLKYNRNKIVVLPSPLEIEKFKPKKLKNKKIKKIFFVGRLVNYKGLQYLIKSASILKKKRNDFRVYIIGDGPLKDFLIKITKRFNLEKFVIFLGKLRNDDVIKLLKKDCDIFVLPSVYRSEALGMSMVEAMAIGIPVVSTKIKGSGVVFVNKNNITGFVVEPRNSLKLAQALDKLLNDFELRKKFGQNGRKRTLKLFNLNSYVKKLIKIYKVI